MKRNPIPENEKERLKALHDYQILDTSAEPDFDGLVQLASEICETPIALITLIDEKRQWFKSALGISLQETAREISFCAHTIMDDDVLVVADASKDARFFDNPYVVGDPQIRFYAGMPLITKHGFHLGSLCVIDQKPRRLTEKQLNDLRILGKQVINLLDLRVQNLALKEQVQKKSIDLQHILERITDGFIALDKDWKITFVNKQAAQLAHREIELLIGANFWDVFPNLVGSNTQKAYFKALQTQAPITAVDFYSEFNLWLENIIYPSTEGLSIFIRDLSEQKKAEEILRDSTEHLERAEEQAKLGSWYFIPTTKKWHWSRQMFRLLELGGISKIPSLQQVLNQIHPDDRQYILDTIYKMEIGDMPERKFFRSSHNQAKFKYLIPSFQIVKDLNGEVLKFEGTLQDVTEQKKFEEALNLSDAKYRSIFENAMEGIYQSTPNGQFITANPSLAKILGYDSPEDLMSSVKDIGFQLYFDKQQRFKVKKMLVKEGATQGYELQVLKKNKEIIWVRDNIRAVYNPDKSIKYFEGTLEDITERKEAEERLTKSENTLRAFFRSTPDCSILIGKKFEVIAYNDAANKLSESTHGVPLQEGTNFVDLIFPSTRPMFKEFILKSFGGETSHIELPILNIHSKERVWWLVVFMPAFDSEGKIFGAIANYTNIDELKKAEIKLKNQFDELKKTNYELDRFVYSVSHDLRSPLSSVLGLLNVAEMENPSDNFKQYLTLIRGSINKLDGFIKDILDYSRNARTDLRIEKIDFENILIETQKNFIMLAGAERLKIDIRIDVDSDFYSDPTRMTILFNNLISNAIKYQDYNKAESILLIEVWTSPKNVQIKISDNGIGIGHEHVEKVFDMFYRASLYSKGSGLGLYIVSETLAKLNGKIKVDSKLGEYTTFEMVIPNLIGSKVIA
jgi:PAS domain S-box-containing protein